MDLRSQFRIVKTWWPLLVGSVVLAAGSAYLVTSVQPKVYEAESTLIVGQSLTGLGTDYSQLLVSQRLSTTYATVATTRPLLDKVIASLTLDGTADDLAKRVRADAPLDSTLLSIAAQDADPQRAAAIANALAAELVAASPAVQGRQYDLQRSVDEDLQATQDQIRSIQARVEVLSGLADRTAAQETELSTLESRLVTLRSTYSTLLAFVSTSAPNVLSVVQPAVAASTPISPKPLLNAMLAAVVGLLVAAVIVIVIQHLDDTIRDPDEVREVVDLSTVGSISRMEGDTGRGEIYRLATLLYPRSEAAEEYRALRTNIEFAAVDKPIRTILVTSAVPGEGKTVTAANLAVVIAQTGKRVLLVDADLRKPGIDEIFDVPNSHGLTDLLRTDQIGITVVSHATEQERLRVLTTGPLPPNPAEVLVSQRMRQVLKRLTTDHDVVVVDSAPLQAVTDAAILSSFVDATLLVIDAGHTRRAHVRGARESLERANARVVGAVLNCLKGPAHAGIKYYYDSYELPRKTAAQPRLAEPIDPPMPVRAPRRRTVADGPAATATDPTPTTPGPATAAADASPSTSSPKTPSRRPRTRTVQP